MLNKKVREHEAKLDEAGDLQRFLRDLDHFQSWLTATQRQVRERGRMITGKRNCIGDTR